LQGIELQLGFPDAYITGDTTRLAQWTGRVNQALDKVFHFIFKADGKWQFDDSGHTTYPILTGNLVDGQRDYSFIQDSDGNLILDIQRVFVRTSSTSPYYEIYPIDSQSNNESQISNLVDGLNVEGQPYQYDKTATGLFLDPIPSANVTSGLKVYVSREGSYFATSDTTKKPGFAGLYHDYLILEPSYQYALANRLDAQEALKREVLEMEIKIVEFYSKRDFHDRPIMTMKKINFI
jgi:hypothetical protein